MVGNTMATTSVKWDIQKRHAKEIYIHEKKPTHMKRNEQRGKRDLL